MSCIFISARWSVWFFRTILQRSTSSKESKPSPATVSQSALQLNILKQILWTNLRHCDGVWSDPCQLTMHASAAALIAVGGHGKMCASNKIKGFARNFTTRLHQLLLVHVLQRLCEFAIDIEIFWQPFCLRHGFWACQIVLVLLRHTSQLFCNLLLPPFQISSSISSSAAASDLTFRYCSRLRLTQTNRVWITWLYRWLLLKLELIDIRIS